ncbi:hypothetical protein ES703_60591 [subsurface metagenome]
MARFSERSLPTTPFLLKGVMMKKHKKTKKHKSTFNDFYADAPRDDRCKNLLALTDVGNSWRLAEAIGGAARFSSTSNCWLWWDGTRWNRTEGNDIVCQKAIKRITAIAEELGSDADLSVRIRLLKWAKQSQSKKQIDASIATARTHPFFLSYDYQFDQNPWLLNCLSGTIDLHTGKLHEHKPTDMITKLAPCEFGGLDLFDEDDEAYRLWHKFLRDTTGDDKEFEKFLQTAIGYSLTGDTSEEKIFFVYGATASGKSTFLEAVKSVLGDYAVTADFETFLKRRDIAGSRPDIARLSGARFVTSIEVDEGKRMAEGLVKTITGGDTIAARHLYESYFEFKPQFKLWLAANTAPRISDKDSAMWRRIVRLPFEHIVPRRKRNPKVKAQLTSGGEFGAVILAWMVKGAVRWHKQGLKLPVAVRDSTKEYQAEMNPLKTFFEECCIFSDDARVCI